MARRIKEHTVFFGPGRLRNPGNGPSVGIGHLGLVVRLDLEPAADRAERHDGVGLVVPAPHMAGQDRSREACGSYERVARRKWLLISG